MAKPSPGLMSFSLHASRDFETIGYAQFHVMCEFDCKFEKEETIFITQFTVQSLFAKTNLN